MQERNICTGKKKKFEELPTTRILEKLGIPRKAVALLGGRKAVAEMLDVPLEKSKYNKERTVLEKWEGKSSKAFEIEAEAREKGMRYADIQKAKTLALVGGVQI